MCSSRRTPTRTAGLRSIGLALCLLVILIANGPLTATVGHAPTLVAAGLLVPAVALVLVATFERRRAAAPARQRADHAPERR